MTNANLTVGQPSIQIMHFDPNDFDANATVALYDIAEVILTNASLNGRMAAIFGPGTAAGDTVLQPVADRLQRPLFDIHIGGPQLVNPAYNPNFLRLAYFIESPVRAIISLLKGIGVRRVAFVTETAAVRYPFTSYLVSIFQEAGIDVPVTSIIESVSLINAFVLVLVLGLSHTYVCLL